MISAHRRLGRGVVARVRAIDWADDAGQVGGVEVLPFGILVFVIGSLLVVNAWAVIDCKLAVDAASREAVRTFVEAPSGRAARSGARIVAEDAIAAHGRDKTKLTIDSIAVNGEPFAGNSLPRCARASVSVSYPVPAITLPIIGSRGDGFRVSSTHSEIIDPYRSSAGLTGEAACAP